MNFKTWFENEDYRGTHKAPDRENGAPLHDLSKIYPDDIYGPNGARYYGHGDSSDYFTISIIQAAKNKPHMQVKIYRAVPKVLSTQEKITDLEKQKKYILKTGKVPPAARDYYNNNSSKYYDVINNQLDKLKSEPVVENEKIKINFGDWVTINRQYAVLHGESSLHGKYRILSKTVSAKTLYTDGNSIHEWGYNP